MQENLLYWEQPIQPSFQFSHLWETSKSHICLDISNDVQLPSFQIAGDVLEEICHRNRDCILKCFKSKENNFCIEEVSYDSANTSEYNIPLQTSRISQNQVQRICEWAIKKADASTDMICRLPEALDYLITIASYTIKESIGFTWN